MEQVFQAKDLLTDQIVALKRIFMKQPQRGLSRSASSEVKALRSIKNENVVRLIDVHRQDIHFFPNSI